MWSAQATTRYGIKILSFWALTVVSNALTHAILLVPLKSFITSQRLALAVA